MPNLGPMEIGLIVLVVLLLFGASRLPKLGRSMGQSIRGFKEGLNEDADDDELESAEPLQLKAADTQGEQTATVAETAAAAPVAEAAAAAPAAETTASAAPANGSIADQLERLRGMLDAGTLTQDEFEAAKQKALQAG